MHLNGLPSRERRGCACRSPLTPLATLPLHGVPVPPYETSSSPPFLTLPTALPPATTAQIDGHAPDSPAMPGNAGGRRSSIPLLKVPNPRHPRVAVLLGVDRRWNIPLMLCRALSTSSALWWAVVNGREIWRSRSLLAGGLEPFARKASDVSLGKRLAMAQVVLAFGWVSILYGSGERGAVERVSESLRLASCLTQKRCL